MHRLTHLIPAGFAAFVVSAIILGCGGSGSGGGSATAASTTGASTTTGTSSTTATSTSATSTGATQAHITFTVSPNPIVVSQQAQTCAITLSDDTPTSATSTYIWDLESPQPGPNNTTQLFPPGVQRTLLTTDGKPFPTGSTSLKQAIYVSNWTNEFPISSTNGGQTGSWIQMASSNWVIDQPYFIHP